MQFNYEDDNAVYAMHVQRGIVSPLPPPPQFFHSFGTSAFSASNPSHVSTVSYAKPVPLRPMPSVQTAQIRSPISYAMPEEEALAISALLSVKNGSVSTSTCNNADMNKRQRIAIVSPTTAPDQVPASIPLKKRKVEMDDDMSFPLLPLEEPPETLALPSDAGNVNLLHQRVRSTYLEIFQVIDDEYDPKYRGKGAYRGRIGLRCKFCAHQATEELQSGSLFFPKDDYDGLYRGVCAWQRTHFMACMKIPDEVKREYKSLKDMSKTRGRKVYWKTSANEIGLVNAVGKPGIVYQSTKKI